jgi:DNA-binding transcriptional LysR family regulator
MNDHRLITFITLARLKNYTQTATALNLTHPAVSQHIQFLEDYYGVSLVVRGKRKTQLTEEGLLFLTYAQRAVSLAEGIKKTLQNQAGIQKKYSIGTTLTIGEYILPAILEGFKQEHPNINISMYVENTANIIKKMTREEIDLALVEGPFNREKYRYRMLKKDSLVLVVAAKHPLASGPGISLEELRREKLILREEGSGTRLLFEQALLKAGTALSNFNLYLEIGSLNAIRSLVLADLGVTIISREVVKEELRAGSLRAVTIADLDLDREFCFVYLPQPPAQDFIAHFADFCARKIAGEGEL